MQSFFLIRKSCNNGPCRNSKWILVQMEIVCHSRTQTLTRREKINRIIAGSPFSCVSNSCIKACIFLFSFRYSLTFEIFRMTNYDFTQIQYLEPTLEDGGLHVADPRNSLNTEFCGYIKADAISPDKLHVPPFPNVSVQIN